LSRSRAFRLACGARGARRAPSSRSEPAGGIVVEDHFRRDFPSPTVFPLAPLAGFGHGY